MKLHLLYLPENEGNSRVGVQTTSVIASLTCCELFVDEFDIIRLPFEVIFYRGDRGEEGDSDHYPVCKPMDQL